MKNRLLLTLTIITLVLLTIKPTQALPDALPVTNLTPQTNNFTIQQLKEMPLTIQYAELYCYGNLVTAGDWGGVSLSYLLNQANITSDVQSIQFTASDNYKVSIPIELALKEGTIIAYEMNSWPLGGLRLVLPGMNGDVWIDQIISIAMSTNIVSGPSAVSSSTVTNPTNLDATTKTNPRQDPTPIPSQRPIPTPTPTPDITAPPAYNPEPVQPTTQQQTKGIDNASVITVTVAVLIIILATAGIFTYKRKRTN